MQFVNDLIYFSNNPLLMWVSTSFGEISLISLAVAQAQQDAAYGYLFSFFFTNKSVQRTVVCTGDNLSY